MDDIKHCYIVPLCGTHNASNGKGQFDYPKWFELKHDPELRMVHITTHECVVENPDGEGWRPRENKEKKHPAAR